MGTFGIQGLDSQRARFLTMGGPDFQYSFGNDGAKVYNIDGSDEQLAIIMLVKWFASCLNNENERTGCLFTVCVDSRDWFCAPLLDFSGKLAFIIGGGRGIGWVIVKALAAGQLTPALAATTYAKGDGEGCTRWV
jgi:hypothetical protein